MHGYPIMRIGRNQSVNYVICTSQKFRQRFRCKLLLYVCNKIIAAFCDRKLYKQICDINLNLNVEYDKIFDDKLYLKYKYIYDMAVLLEM